MAVEKTAIQELIEIVEMDYNNGVEISMKVFYGMLTKALEKEKHQIKKAYSQGCLDTYKKEPKKGQGEKYYIQTFRNEIDKQIKLVK